jgi:hypothetical protein
MKRMGARDAGSPHVACDAEGLETWHGRDDPTGTGTPVLDPTCERLAVRCCPVTHRNIYFRSEKAGQRS